MMRRCLALIAALFAFTPGAWADQVKLSKAGGEAAMILSAVAEMMIATGMCTLGDRQDWQRVVDAVDRRYRFCVAKDPSWASLMAEFKNAEKQRSFGSLAVEAFLDTRGAEARRMGMQAFCSKLPWKMVLVPGAATPEAKAEHMKAHPKATLDEALAFFGYIRGLGTDTSWVERPCEDFWPPFPGSR
jgi:hypothetical protein